MRLLELSSAGQLSLTKEFIGDNIPKYAILSHTWGADTEEVTYQDLVHGTGVDKSGYQKILFCGRQARRDGLQYFWVDTCCIDKANSAELTEAINSMFRWYRNAARCYVYLSDVSTDDHDPVAPSSQPWQSAFRDSRWFTRGWTLQELIAPASVEFFCSKGRRLGDKKTLERQLHEITGIAVTALQGTTSLFTLSVEERMSWARHRDTKREEDKAYSLLGIFDVNMPLIYGEQSDGAFRRLQEEIYKRGKKRQLDEIITASQPMSNPNKRLRPPRSQSFVVPPLRNPESSDSNLLFCPEDSVHNSDVTTRQSLIEQLYFSQIDERLTGLTAAQGSSCRWFLTKSEFISWHDVAQHPDHGGFLWLKGHPGTGKSTLMKFLFEDAKLKAKSNSSQIILSFFFLARGTIEEKSTVGLYRSLLHQLFQKAADLKDSLEWMTADGARVVQRNGWNEETLKQTLAHTVKKLGGRSLMIFVDALDECDQDHAAGMVSFFEDLCDCAKEAQVRLQICFSSRHYPTVVIQQGLEITLEDETGHEEDIKHYIQSKLRLGKSDQAESLRSEILEKSSGIFLWVILVLDILNSEYPNSSISIKKIRKRLKEIPPKLTDLFEMILVRDGENLKQLQLCLKWILFATRPLKPQELYFAIQLGLDKSCSSCWDQEDVDLNRMKTFVRSSSKGLAEVTRNKASNVQFIHESVRDFLLGKYGKCDGQWAGINGNFVGHSHEILRDCCLAQLTTPISREVYIPATLPKAAKAAGLREYIRLKFPFLRYSILNVLHHANSAQQNAIEQRGFLADFPLQEWILLNNIHAKYDVRRYTKSVSVLYILAEKNLASLIRIHPQTGSCFDVENEHYGPPIFAALAIGSHEAVQTLLETEAAIHSQEPSLRYLCKQYSENKNKRTSFGRDFAFSRQKGPYIHAAEQGNEFILTFLSALGKSEVNSKDTSNRTPLSWAAEGGHESVVKLLLEEGAEIDAPDDYDQTPLLLAARGGHEGVVKLLLEKGAKIEAQDEKNQTPLLLAARGGHEGVVKLLLEKGAKIEAQDEENQTPLLLAATGGHEEVVKLLLEEGTKIDAQDNINHTPLFWAAKGGHEGVVELLLEKGAEIDAPDDCKQTPLFLAVQYGRVEIVKLLLEEGAEVDAQDYACRTPLSRAVVALWGAGAGKEYKAVVELLLEKGAKLDARDQEGRTPLSWAVEGKFDTQLTGVKVLLEKGAKLNLQDNDGKTPLYWARKRGHEAKVKLLLEKGAQ